MSKLLSYKGIITPGTDAQRIKLSTLNGKTGYKINKFQIIGKTPGTGNAEYLCQIYSKNHSVTAEVDFTDDDLLAVAFLIENGSTAVPTSNLIIFDHKIVNQDIYIAGTDVSGGTVPVNFYLELEAMSLSDIQATQITLRNLRTIASR
tara:strand:+ start:166 stop:609 length:444 start_codon:yes stop_codon:yes gene_type:complete